MKAVSLSSKKQTQQDLIRPKLRKTKLCSFFQEGRCRRGDACGFAHSMDELEVTPNLTKTSICLAWKEGVCPNSSTTCRFAHGKHDLRMLPPSKSDEGKDETASLLAKPPGLLPQSAPHETQVPSATWPTGLLPMKVHSAAETKKTAGFLPMKVQPSGEAPAFAQWKHWESETVAGESSSDDDGHSSRLQSQGASPTALFLQGYKDQLEELMQASTATTLDEMPMMMPETFDMSMFEAESDLPDLPYSKFDAAAAMGGMQFGAEGAFGFPPSSGQMLESLDVQGYGSSEYSPFGGMPRIMW
jgi:hypothetical protein